MLSGLICVGIVGNAAPILILEWEHRSHFSLYSRGPDLICFNFTIYSAQ